MSFRLADYKAKTKPVNVTLDDQSFSVGYRPAAFTPALESKLKADAASGNDNLTADLLATLVVESDVLGEDGGPLVWSTEVLVNEPSVFLRAVFEAVIADLTPGEASAAS